MRVSSACLDLNPALVLIGLLLIILLVTESFMVHSERFLTDMAGFSILRPIADFS
jgi:hypothetical protein